ncbi:MAG: DUF3795 domain-containing protein [Bacteroidales bacterium]|nr:DUF3795 domain-containing protein [Bacteroidales bacterium]
MYNNLKKYETIGCCGIDCGLCPRFYTKGDSACPGCGGLNFSEKHPSCGILNCCVIKHGFEVCSECKDYPCKRFDAEKDGYDSFVTHKKVFTNLSFIKDNGIEPFIENQKIRIDILMDLLTHYDDGRSKSFFCLSCALIPAKKLEEILAFAHSLKGELELKEKSKLIKNTMTGIAASEQLELKLNKKNF